MVPITETLVTVGLKLFVRQVRVCSDSVFSCASTSCFICSRSFVMLVVGVFHTSCCAVWFSCTDKCAYWWVQHIRLAEVSAKAALPVCPSVVLPESLLHTAPAVGFTTSLMLSGGVGARVCFTSILALQGLPNTWTASWCTCSESCVWCCW